MIDRSVLANPALWLEPANDGRHALRDAPLMRESIPYVLSLPEAGIAAFVYTWVDRQNVAGYACAIYGPGVANGPIVGRLDGVAVAADTNFDNWKVGPFELYQDLKMDKARVRWTVERATLDFEFEAMHPAYGFANDPRGCWQFFADDRLEQSGTARGTITVDGKVTAFDTTAHRDHSWGTRDWERPAHWKWLVTQAGPDAAVHVFQMFVRGKVELRGYVFKEGRMSEVTGFDCDFTLDDELRQKTLVCDVHDAIGRTTRIESTCFAVQLLAPEPHIFLYEGALDLTIDGNKGVGWVEFMWRAGEVEHARKIAALRKG